MVVKSVNVWFGAGCTNKKMKSEAGGGRDDFQWERPKWTRLKKVYQHGHMQRRASGYIGERVSKSGASNGNTEKCHDCSEGYANE